MKNFFGNAFAWIAKQYQTNSKFRGAVQAAEAGAALGIGSISLDPHDVLTSHGLKHVGVAVGGGALFALRNYFLNRPGQPAQPNPTETETPKK